MDIIIALITGIFYGLIIGIIPGAGATTGLVALFPMVSYMITSIDPYTTVVFLMAVVAASTTSDTYSSVLLGIPGANSAAATMIDGFPLAMKGKATYAISAAVTVSTINGIIWGILTFALLPFYTRLMLIFGIPELWAFTILATATVVFVSSNHWVRGISALLLGIFLGIVGTDPVTNSDRFTFGWDYLGNGIQLMPLVAGLFAIPEMIDGLRSARGRTQIHYSNNRKQTILGIKAAWKHRWLALRGGVIGAFIGILPGLGGAMADWMAYGQALATTPNPTIPFGKGNIRGVIGPEGANNAQKATSMIPTVLFGIPGAPFAALLMALFAYLGFDLGTPDLIHDYKFFNSMLFGFLAATVLVGILCLFITPVVAKITMIPYYYYFPILLALITWASVQYTGGWEDYVVLGLASILGISCKKWKFNRPALLIGFILAERIEALTLQLTTLYSFETVLQRPIFVVIMLLTILVLVWGIVKNKNKLEYN